MIKILKIFIQKLIEKFYLLPFNHDKPSTVNHEIDGKRVSFICLGRKSRNRSLIAFYKEPDTMSWIDSFNTESSFLDIGSNIGMFSIYAAKKKKCRVYSIEPSINSNYIFLLNIGNNDLNHKVTLYQVLLSNKNIDMRFETSSPNNNLNNLHGLRPRNVINNLNSENSYQKNYANYTLLTSKLDQINFDDTIENVKIDVDGNEMQLLEGATEFFYQKNINSVMVELDEKDKNYKKILEFFYNHNFKRDFRFSSLTKISEDEVSKVYNHYFYRNE